MKMAGLHKPALRGYLIALAIILIGVAVAVYAYVHTSRYPSTDDATIDADVVHVATPVGGRIVKLAVTENQHV